MTPVLRSVRRNRARRSGGSPLDRQLIAPDEAVLSALPLARTLLRAGNVNTPSLILTLSCLCALACPARGMELRLLGVAGQEPAPAAVPVAVRRPATGAARHDPLANFDYLWGAFDRNYAFFRERGVDWGEARKRYRSQLTPASTPAELHAVCRAMLDSLNDDHVSLEVPAAIRTPGPPPVDFAAVQQAIVARYVCDARSLHGGKIRWGSIDDRVGYLQINTMEEFALTSEGDVRIVRSAMDTVVRAFARKELVILDIRFNGGGYDDVSLEILGRFARRRERVLSRKVRRGDGFSPPEHVFVTPAASRLRGRVALLTSPETASAAETLALASMPMDHFTRIGSATNGILSDKEEGKMPNGWTYSLSNMVVEAHDGQVYEVRGITPHHRIDYARDARTLERQILEALPGGDPAIEQALSLR